MDMNALQGGFHAAPQQAARAFRAVMNAMAMPGRIETVAGALPPAPLSVAAGTVILTLCDGTTPVHLAGAFDVPAVRDWVTFHTGAPLVGPEAAVFAVGVWGDFDLGRYAIGTDQYPDRSATLIVECAALEANGHRLVGPGIKGEARLRLPEVAAFERNALLFPLGLDFYFTAQDRVAALPRTTRVEDALARFGKVEAV